MTTVLQAPLPGASPFSNSPLHSSSYPDLSSLNTSTSFRQPHSQPTRYSRHDYGRIYSESGPSTAPSSPQLTYSSRRDSYASTPASSLSRDHADVDDEEDDTAFPAFERADVALKPIEASPTLIESEELSSETPNPPAEDPALSSSSIQDDHAIQAEPTRHVDYLSHEWKEETSGSHGAT